MSKIILEKYNGDDSLRFSNQMSVLRMEIEDEVTVSEMMQNFKLFMIACGYSKEALDAYIEDE